MRALARALLIGLGIAAPAFPAVAQTAPAQGLTASEGAVLRGLDKVSGQTRDIPVTRGQPATFERLQITLVACRYPANNPAGEAFAFVEIADRGVQVFRGWMVASAPALNALDHARYDVWVLSCQT